MMRPISAAARRLAGHSPMRMQGIGLIEVMVSVLILAVGLLGIAAMQSQALRNGQSSLESSQAVVQTTSIIEAMHANSANAASYNGTWTTPPAAPTTLALRDINEWVASMQGVANWRGATQTPGTVSSTAKATITGCPDCVITIQWDDSRAGTLEGGTTRSIVTEARL